MQLMEAYNPLLPEVQPATVGKKICYTLLSLHLISNRSNHTEHTGIRFVGTRRRKNHSCKNNFFFEPIGIGMFILEENLSMLKKVNCMIDEKSEKKYFNHPGIIKKFKTALGS